jgi:hypothetical protein
MHFLAIYAQKNGCCLMCAAMAGTITSFPLVIMEKCCTYLKPLFRHKISPRSIPLNSDPLDLLGCERDFQNKIMH